MGLGENAKTAVKEQNVGSLLVFPQALVCDRYRTRNLREQIMAILENAVDTYCVSHLYRSNCGESAVIFIQEV